MYYTIVKQTSTVADLEISVLRCVADMLKIIFSLELELQFLQVYHEVASSSQNKMLSQVERLSIVAERLSKFCKEAGLDDFEWTANLPSLYCRHPLLFCSKACPCGYIFVIPFFCELHSHLCWNACFKKTTTAS